jgi:hypothetical protein
MAIFRATHVSNIETAVPYVTNEASEIGARLKIAADSYEVDWSDFSDGDVILLEKLPAEAKIISLKMASDDLDSGSDAEVEIGVYKLDETAGDADVFASAVTDFQSATSFTEYRFEADAIDDLNKKLYELAGDSDSDHDSAYYIALTLTDLGAQDGTIAWQITYAVQ